MFDLEKARQKGMDERSIAIMAAFNENTARRESCAGHDFEQASFGNYRCRKCGCEEDVKYVTGYRDGLKHQKVDGNTSDGYHTFNELYHHRAVLFSVICNEWPELAWKSKKHHDGTMYDGMFIVGIETPEGQATYHYDMEPYWEMFRVPELPQAPEWDEHTPAQAIERIALMAREKEVNK